METIHLVAPLLPSVGRISGHGSCILLSMTPDTTGDPSKCRAILLTTSHCLTRRVDAHGLEAIFFENPLEGSSTGSTSTSSAASSGSNRYSRTGAPQQPVKVLLRPEQVFITSAEDPKAKKNLMQQQFLQNSQFLQEQKKDGSSSSSGGTTGNNNDASSTANGNQPSTSHNIGKKSSGSSSSQQQQQQEQSIGYTIVACDVEGRFLEKYQHQQEMQNKSFRKLSLHGANALNAQNQNSNSNANNKSSALANDNNTNNYNDFFSLDALGNEDSFQARTASKYRPLFDKKAIERAAQARLEQVTERQQQEQRELEEAQARKSMLAQRMGTNNTSGNNFHGNNKQAGGLYNNNRNNNNNNNNNNNRNNTLMDPFEVIEDQDEEPEYYFDEVTQKVIKREKKKALLETAPSFHRVQSGILSRKTSLEQQQSQQQHHNRVTNTSLVNAASNHLQQQAPPTISSVIPIGLPLIQKRCPAVNKGDTHLVITHAEGGPTRKIYSLSVSETHENYCVYNEVDSTVMFASGGVVFSTSGEFIGIQHQSPGPDSSHYCMFIKEITQHLFLTHSLSSIQVPIVDGNVEDVDGMVGTVAKSIFDRDLFILGEDPLWKRQRDALIRGNPIDQEMLNRAPPQSGILTGDARAMHVRTKSRYGGNYSQLVEFSELERERNLRNRNIPKTLLVCDHLEVFEAYYQPDNYSSLVHMIGSFGYHPELTKLMLSKLVSHEHRNDLMKFAEHQGMPPLLEVMERNGENADITQAGVTALGRLTQFELNREALNRYSGLQTLLAILQGWPHHVQIIEWGCFCLMNMTEKTTLRSKENVKTISESEGMSLMCGFVKNLGINGPASAHICRWGFMSLSNLIGEDKSLFDQAIAQNNDLCSIVVDGIVQFSNSSYALHGVSACFLTLVHLELFDAAVDFFIHAGALSRVLSILQALSSAWTTKATSSFIAPSSSMVASINANATNDSDTATNLSSPYNNNINDNSRHGSNNNHHQSNTVSQIGTSASSSFGSAADAVVAQNFLTALHHIVQLRPAVKSDLVYLGAAEIASTCARVFAKEGELVNVVASLVSSLSR